MSKIVLDARRLNKSYASNGLQNHVLIGIDLSIHAGDFTVMMGPSGSGKSTLLYCLSGMEKVTDGHVYFKTKDITSFTETELGRLRRDDFGFVFQQIHLVGSLSLFENVAVAGYLKPESSAKKVRENVTKLLDLVHLSDAKHRLPSQVSGGEQQRAAVARALINEPAVLFADEPTGQLNQKNSDAVLDLLTRVHANGQTVVMVTHDRQAALRGNRILYLIDGKVVGELTLPPYSEERFKDREIQLTSWLSSLSW